MSQMCRYVRLLGAFYMRLVGKPVEIYTYLEPLLIDMRRVRLREPSGRERCPLCRPCALLRLAAWCLAIQLAAALEISLILFVCLGCCLMGVASPIQHMLRRAPHLFASLSPRLVRRLRDHARGRAGRQDARQRLHV